VKKTIVLQATLFTLLFVAALSFGQQAVSEEAKRHSDRGMAAVKMAKTVEGYDSRHGRITCKTCFGSSTALSKAQNGLN
jgi:hypothetical protein